MAITGLVPNWHCGPGGRAYRKASTRRILEREEGLGGELRLDSGGVGQYLIRRFGTKSVQGDRWSKKPAGGTAAYIRGNLGRLTR